MIINLILESKEITVSKIKELLIAIKNNKGGCLWLRHPERGELILRITND